MAFKGFAAYSTTQTGFGAVTTGDSRYPSAGYKNIVNDLAVDPRNANHVIVAAGWRGQFNFASPDSGAKNPSRTGRPSSVRVVAWMRPMARAGADHCRRPRSQISSATAAPRDYGRAEPIAYPDPDVVALDPRFRRYVVFNAAIKRLHIGTSWAEGPAWNGVGRYLVWSDIPNNVQMRWIEEDSRVTTFRNPSGYSNGNTFDYQGRFLSCEHDTRRVVRYEPDGTVTVIADKWQGKPLNAPNDVVVASDGAASGVRNRLAGDLGPHVEMGGCRFIWLATDRVFEAFTFIFVETPAGVLQIHAYPYDADASTFIVEMREEVWRGLGFVITEARFYDLSSKLPQNWHVAGIPIDWMGPIIMIVLALVFHVLMTQFHWGRAVFAVGGNETAALFSTLGFTGMTVSGGAVAIAGDSVALATTSMAATIRALSSRVSSRACGTKPPMP